MDYVYVMQLSILKEILENKTSEETDKKKHFACVTLSHI